MIPFTTLTWQAAGAGRWTARIVGTLMVLFLFAFVIGEGPPSFARMTAREQLFALGMGSLFLGLIVAFFREGWGGLLSVLGWGFLSVVEGRPQWDLPFSIPAGAGLLHLLCWWRLRGPAPSLKPLSVQTAARLKMLFVALWAWLAVFVLLCANEMFGQPPLMTPSGSPPSWMVGTWSTTVTTAPGQPLSNEIPVLFAIGTDGSVTGTVDKAEVTGGRFLINRSWFGRLMNWRTDYMIHGSLPGGVESYGGTAGAGFSAPLYVRGPELHGSLFVSHPSRPKPLGIHLKKR